MDSESRTSWDRSESVGFSSSGQIDRFLGTSGHVAVCASAPAFDVAATCAWPCQD